jgi:hypothetical protein
MDEPAELIDWLLALEQTRGEVEREQIRREALRNKQTQR